MLTPGCTSLSWAVPLSLGTVALLSEKAPLGVLEGWDLGDPLWVPNGTDAPVPCINGITFTANLPIASHMLQIISRLLTIPTTLAMLHEQL